MLSLRILAGIACLSAGSIALACSCAPPPPVPQALQQSVAVFLGKVAAIESAPGQFGPLTVTLDVERWWKGGDAGQIKVKTANNGAACGFHFQKDARYLVYAHDQGKGVWNVSLCSRSSAATTAQAADDQKILGAGTAPKGK